MLRALKPSPRILMGPGPSDVHPEVLRSLSIPLLGHLDPEFLEIMNDIMELLRQAFGTENLLTVPMSGTGSAGMETVFANLLEPGDHVLIGVNGLFGQRMADVARRCGGIVTEIHADWGDTLSEDELAAALEANPDIGMVAVVHAETSTGVQQPLKGISDLAHSHDCLFVVDAVTSLGGIPVDVDQHGVDACYSGTQKCLSAPPGLAPVSLGYRALERMDQRKTPVQSWYLDLSMIRSYWGSERSYHHTAPISMNYALREALRLLFEEGLDNVYQRHARLGKALQNGLEAMGLDLHVAEKHRLPQLTSVRIPKGIDDMTVRRELLAGFGIEIGGGLGELKGVIWRVGLMGHSCSPNNVMLFLSAMEQILRRQGMTIPEGVGPQAAWASL